MIGFVIDGRYIGSSVYMLPEKNVLYILTEDDDKIALSQKNVISVDSVANYNGEGKKVIRVLWKNNETSIIQFGAVEPIQEKSPERFTEHASPKEEAPRDNTPAEKRVVQSIDEQHKDPAKNSIKDKYNYLARCILQVIAIILIFVPQTLTLEIWERENVYTETYTHHVYSSEANIPYALFETVHDRIICTIVIGVFLACAIFCATVYILQFTEKLPITQSMEKKALYGSIIEFAAAVILCIVVMMEEKTPSLYMYKFVPNASFFYLHFVLLVLIIILRYNKTTDDR